MKKYYESLDVGKFIAALMVISIHTDPVGMFKGTMIFDAWKVITDLAVPFFFLCTGFFVGQSIEKTGISIIWKRAVSFAKIYTIWTAFYLPLTVYSYIVHKNGIANDLFCFFRGFLVWGNHDWSWQLWYLLCAVYSLIFIFILKRLNVNYKVIWGIVIALYIIGSILTYMVEGGMTYFPKAKVIAILIKKTIGSGRMLTGPLCLWIGINANKIKKIQRGYLLGIIIIGIVASVITNSFCATIMRPIVVTAIFFSLIDLSVVNGMQKMCFRTASSYIYYIHMYFVFLTNYVMKLPGAPRFALTTLLTVAVTYAFIGVKNIIGDNR